MSPKPRLIRSVFVGAGLEEENFIEDDAAREAMAAKSLEGSVMHTFDRRVAELLRVCKI